MRKSFLIPLLSLACQTPAAEKQLPKPAVTQLATTMAGKPWKTIGEIPVPPGFERTIRADGSFTAWLRRLPLRADKTVYLYNGWKKRNQSAQYAVIDQPLAGGELEQCADVIIHLRTLYLLSAGKRSQIRFSDNAKHEYTLTLNADAQQLQQYLATVFARCGTASLEKQLPLVPAGSAEAGDVLIKGGAPGHAMLIADMAKDKNGHTIYLLLQGYMPAQDMHVVINPLAAAISPWYRLDTTEIETPEWTFSGNDLHSWERR